MFVELLIGSAFLVTEKKQANILELINCAAPLARFFMDKNTRSALVASMSNYLAHWMLLLINISAFLGKSGM